MDAPKEIPQHGGLYEFVNGQMVAIEGGPQGEGVSAPEKAQAAEAGTDVTSGEQP